MIYNLLAWLGHAIGITYANDRTAFFTGIVMAAVLFFVPGHFFITGYIIAAYFVVLYLAARRGQKIGLGEAFHKAAANFRAAGKDGSSSPAAISHEPEAVSHKPDTIPDKREEPPPPPLEGLALYGRQPAPVIKRGVKFVGDFLNPDEAIKEQSLDIVEVERHLLAGIYGQDHAISAVMGTLKKTIAGLRTKKEKPLCVFLLVGATGTGKTELVKQIAGATKRPLVRLDMPNYKNGRASVWELIGSPPGYVGSDKPGHLTGEIQANPNAVLLMDEIEKADKEIWDPFLRVLDEGKLKDQAAGFTADFKNVMIFLTSNLMQFDDHIEDEKELRGKVLNSGYFRPEMLNRIDTIIMFKRFDIKTYFEIIALSLQNYLDGFLCNNKLNAEVRIDRAVIEHIHKNIDTKFGVRDVHRYVEKNIGDALADAYIYKADKTAITGIHISVVDNKLEVKL